MSKDFIGYDQLVDSSLRGVVRDALRRVAEQGLVGTHHLYLSFRTDFPGVDVPGFLRERYPEELTIVLQHQFWALEVSEELFSVMLSFNKAREQITVPFAALTRFADPGAKFGLQFEPTPDQPTAVAGRITQGGTVQSAQEAETSPEIAPESEDISDGAEKVVTLDTFRKK